MLPPGLVQHPGPPPTPPRQDSDNGSHQRPLSTTKRAEQNRKAQRAFRERRDLYVPLFAIGMLYVVLIVLLFYRHVKALEQRSQLLDTALAGADEANRRWEETRAIVEQLRIENTALRSALQQAQAQLAAAGIKQVVPGEENNGEQRQENSDAAKGSSS